TDDGGLQWQPASQEAVAASRKATEPPAPSQAQRPYRRFFPPWYLAALIICGWLVYPVVLRPVTSPPPQPTDDANAIGNHPVSDDPLEPGEPDALELGKTANGLSFFLCNQQTKPPLVIGINGRWG